MSVPANFFDSYAIVASPADASETVVAVVGGVGELLPGLSVHLRAWCSFVPGTGGDTAFLAIRRDSLTGTQVGELTEIDAVAADNADGITIDLEVVDVPGDFAGATYVATLQVGNASGASSVVAVHLSARTC